MTNDELVAAFERGAIDPQVWDHRAHIVVARAAVLAHGEAAAADHLRAGLHRLLASFGKTEGYCPGRSA